MATQARQAVGLTLAAALIPLTGQASSHREAPNITRLPAVDSTDFYMFSSYEPSRAGYVTLLADYVPLQDAYGGPNYFALDPTALYEIHIDNDGDAKEDLTFQFRFTNRLANDNQGIKLGIAGSQVAVPLKNVGPISANDSSLLNFNESYTLTLVRGDRRKGQAAPITSAKDGSTSFGKPYDFVGTKSFTSVQGYADYARKFVYDVTIPSCDKPGRVFVGQRREPFAVNLGKVFDLVNLVPVDGSAFPGGITQDPANNQIADKNITTLALEVPASCLKGSGNGVIGGWTSASLRQARILNPKPTFSKAEVSGGPWTQVSRLATPLVNEVVIGLPDKDRFNASQPKDDAQFATYVTNPTLPALLDALFRSAVNQTLKTSFATLAPTNIPRNDLVTAFLTGFPGVNQLAKVTPSEMIRLNTGIAPTAAAQQSPFGVAGGDLAGFPNGRRPGDDVTDIALRVVMGRLCYPIPVNGQQTDLGLCKPSDAPVGNAPFTDGAPVSARDFDTEFPYLRTPVPGAGM
ncbi:MAG TPA: DUF4331 domain-containing protein [Steroidobacteraceae bacterium]|jgi:hypothetical protein|nr:DUF4331 domain-containing protein [Steroidobacteraceae bacterium]